VAVAAVQPPWATLADPADGAWVRAANFAIACPAVRAGDRLTLTDQPDEHLALLVGTGARVETASGVVRAPADALVIVEPGDSAIEPDGDGRVVRVVTTRVVDTARESVNADAYREHPDAVTPLGPPVIGPGTRVHALADHPAGEGEMRVFRSGDLMINVFGPRTRRRDPARLSPHWHDDFEQGSVVLAGSWIHHLRYPWAPDSGTWRPDGHLRCGAPSVTIIPAGVEHTSQDTGEGDSWLVDVFAPPRADFLARGIVRNAADYDVSE
jgi:hypothetical protein